MKVIVDSNNKINDISSRFQLERSVKELIVGACKEFVLYNKCFWVVGYLNLVVDEGESPNWSLNFKDHVVKRKQVSFGKSMPPGCEEYVIPDPTWEQERVPLCGKKDGPWDVKLDTNERQLPQRDSPHGSSSPEADPSVLPFPDVTFPNLSFPASVDDLSIKTEDASDEPLLAVALGFETGHSESYAATSPQPDPGSADSSHSVDLAATRPDDKASGGKKRRGRPRGSKNRRTPAKPAVADTVGDLHFTSAGKIVINELKTKRNVPGAKRRNNSNVIHTTRNTEPNKKKAPHRNPLSALPEQRCSRCPDLPDFESRVELERHHIASHGHNCRGCDAKFLKRKQLDEHFDVAHPELACNKEGNCHICQRHFKKKEKLYAHILRHRGIRDAVCDICGRGFCSQYDLRIHVKKSHSLESFVCEVCGKVYKSQDQKNRHLRVHSDEPSFMCDLCGSGFFTKRSFDYHREKHHVEGDKDGDRKCRVCGQGFPTQSELTLHQAESHDIEHRHDCGRCGEKFTRKHDLQIHLIKEHKNDLDGLDLPTCIICQKAFVNATMLRAHMPSHAVSRDFKCQICDKRLKSDFILRNHIKLKHTLDGRLDHKCPTCGKKFKTRSYLNHHLQSHNTTLDHKCDQCEKAFRVRRQLLVHLRRHTATYDFPCPYCERTFRFLEARKRHLLIHTLEKNYQCPTCGKAFGRSDHLNQHARKCSPGTIITSETLEAGLSTMLLPDVNKDANQRKEVDENDPVSSFLQTPTPNPSLLLQLFNKGKQATSTSS